MPAKRLLMKKCSKLSATVHYSSFNNSTAKPRGAWQQRWSHSGKGRWFGVPTRPVTNSLSIMPWFQYRDKKENSWCLQRTNKPTVGSAVTEPERIHDGEQQRMSARSHVCCQDGVRKACRESTGLCQSASNPLCNRFRCPCVKTPG